MAVAVTCGDVPFFFGFVGYGMGFGVCGNSLLCMLKKREMKGDFLDGKPFERRAAGVLSWN